MNVYDSGRMSDVLAPLGYETTDDAEGADLVILNTCHIREKASEKVFSELGRLRLDREDMAKAGRRKILAVAGCVAQAEGEEIRARAPFVDLVFGPQTYHRLPEMLTKLDRGSAAVIDIDFPAEPKFDHLPETPGVEGGSAFLTVQEGCDKFCAFCVVPYTRGAEFSRPAAAVLGEARRLADAGAIEATLLGQNVNSYHGEAADGSEWGLGRLIREIAERVPEIRRIRYTTSYPADMDDDLISAHGEVDALMPFLHLPVQSGSDRILRAMNRRHDAADYRRLVDRLRRARPDIALSSDFIVGFPGETEDDFRDTMALIRDVGFIQAYSFKYSARPGTPAAALDDQIPDAVKSQRLAELQAQLEKDQRAFNEGCVGRVMTVLFDRKGRHPGQLAGRSPYMQPVHAEVPADRFGAVADVRIDGGWANSLSGVLVSPEPEKAVA